MTGERDNSLLTLSLLWLIYGAFDYSNWNAVYGLLEIQVGLVLQFVGMGGRFIV